MSTDSMPILPETDPASDRWAPQDSNGGKCLQDMSSEVMFESIRISKCLLNESSDSRCGEKPALKMKIVLAEKKEKSELSSNSNRAHEDDEDTDLLEDESDSSAELTIVDDAKADEPPPEQGQEKKKLPKEARKKRKAKEVQAPKSVTMKKRREDREAEKRRVEELFKTQENEAIAKRIAMEFSNFRRFRVSSSDEPSPRVESNPPSDSRDSRSGASPKPTVPESSLRVDLAQPKSSVEKPGYPPRSKELAVDIPSSENLNSISRNGSADSSSQCHASRFEKSMQESKDGFPLPPLPSQGKHHIPIGPPPAPSTLISALSVSHQSAGGVERESPRQSPRRSPEGSLVRLDHMNSEVSIDRTNSSEPSPTIVRTTSVCPGSAPNTIHIPIPLCRIEQLPPKCPSASEQSQRSPQVHGNKQFELSIATRTSPPRLYATLAPLCVEVPLPSGLTTTSNGSQVPATSHSRLRAQNLYGSTTCDSETKQSAERQAELRTSVAPEATKTGGQVFNPKFSAFSVDNLTKIDVRTRETTRSSPSDLIKESQRPNPANSESTLPTGPPQKQSAARAGDPDTSSGKVCVVRQSEFEFARPHVPRKPRSKASSPTPQSSPIHPGCSGSAPTNANGHNPESKSALIWRYIQDQSGGSTMQTIDSALESVRSSSNRLKQDDSYTILANYLQGQRNGDAPDETAREDRTLPDQPMSPNLSADSLDARSLYLTKLKKMLVTLQKFSTTISMDVGKAVYHNIYALASGGANVDEFIAKTQRATKLALKPYVGPFLTAYLPLLQREITVKAAGVRMSSSRFMRSNPDCLIDPAVDAGDPHEVFVSEFDIPNKKKALPSEPSTVDAQVPAQNATLDHLANATVSLEMQDIESRYQTHLTIQNDLMLIQEMLDRISKMVESTKKALSTLQAESSSPMCREMSTKPSPRCSPIVPPHASSPTTTSFAKDLPTSVARLDHLLKSPPRYNSNAQNFSAFNTQQRKPSYAENPLWLPRPASNDVPRAGAFNSLNQTQKDSMACLEMRIPQVMPPAASPTFAMRPSGVPSPTATQKETPPNSNLNPPMPEAVMGYVPQDVLVSGNTDALRKDSAASNSRESFSSSSSSPIPSFLTSAAADKKYQESLRRKSLPTVTSKTPINPSSPQTSISQPTEISDAECCWNCGRSAQETCSGCKLAKYCGLFCQHRDWEVHHRVCRVIGSNSPKSPPSK